MPPPHFPRSVVSLHLEEVYRQVISLPHRLFHITLSVLHLHLIFSNVGVNGSRYQKTSFTASWGHNRSFYNRRRPIHVETFSAFRPRKTTIKVDGQSVKLGRSWRGDQQGNLRSWFGLARSLGTFDLHYAKLFREWPLQHYKCQTQRLFA